MLLEEALAANAVRRPYKAERPIDDELLHARPDQSVMIEQTLLRDLLLRPQKLIGMRKLYDGFCPPADLTEVSPLPPAGFALVLALPAGAFGFSCTTSSAGLSSRNLERGVAHYTVDVQVRKVRQAGLSGLASIASAIPRPEG